VNAELRLQDLEMAFDRCRQEHTDLQMQKRMCQLWNMKEHVYKVTKGKAPLLGQKCFCGEETA